MSGLFNRTVMWVTMRQLLVKQRVITALVVTVIPLAIMWIFLATRRGPAITEVMVAGRFLIGMYKTFVIGTILPLIAIVFGSSAFGSEVSDGTIVYLLTKPESRWRIITSKFIVAALTTVVVMLPAIYLPWLLVNHEEFPISVPTIILGGVALGSFLYVALFTAIGVVSKRALVVGLFYIVIIEFVVSNQAAGVRSFSIRELVLTATAWIGDGNRWIGPGNVTLETVQLMAPVFFFGSLIFAWSKFRKFEISEKL